MFGMDSQYPVSDILSPDLSHDNMDYYKILGYYQSARSDSKSGVNMSAKEGSRRSSQPNILIDSSDSGKSFYSSSNYSSSNYSSSVYGKPGDGKDAPDQSGWLGSKSYAMVPRMGRRASKDTNAKYYKRDNSRSDNKRDYQDIYKDKKESKPKTKTEITRRISVDTGAVIASVPTIPSRMYSKEDDYATFDELFEESSPPNLAPVSGYLPQNSGKAMVRPIAFKPVVTTKASSSSTYSNHSPDNYTTYDKPHIDDGYSSQESRSCSHNGTMRDSYIYESQPTSCDYRETTKQNSSYQVTPSPTSHDTVAHYEQLLQDKERELLTLRDTMEANERVIFQVNEEKRVSWENQMKELTSEYHRRLRLQQDRSYKVEKELRDQLSKLERDNQTLVSERGQSILQKEHNSHMQEQLKACRSKNEELSSRLSSMSCDCESLRQQDREKQINIQNLEELVTVIKADNMNLSNELDEKRRVNKKQEKTTPNVDKDITRLETLLADRDAAVQIERDQFMRDRESWEQEKKKVLQYQRQLQSNYIQMCRRNNVLEASHPTHNNNTPAEKHSAYRHIKSQEKSTFKAHLEATPESLC